LNIIHPILQQSDPVRAHAKREPRNLPRIVSVVPNKLEHIRIDHPASENLNPASLLAWPAGRIIRAAPPTPAANEARNKHLGARLGEREKRRTKTRLHARPEKFLHGMIERPLQIAESDVGVDRQPFDLMKHRRVARIRRIVAM